jgi:geranylgeranyl reductase family protein
LNAFDVIVCGAGPAGSTAALVLAEGGLKVALLEKHTLPRHKTCGGGVPMTASNYIRDLVPEAFVEADVRLMRHTWQFSDPHLAPINPPGASAELSLWMVQRSVFDNALAQKAVAAGAVLFAGHTLQQITVEAGGLSLTGQARDASAPFQLTTRYLIGADGANGVTARLAGLAQERDLAIAMEVEHPYDWENRHPDLRPDAIHLEYGAVPNGYAWIFPKGDHINVGAGFFNANRQGQGGESARTLLKQVICRYMDLFEVPYQPEALKYYAHPLPLWNGKQRVSTSDHRILLAGDAAGLINPLFGDGILPAIRSGRIAAECLLADHPEEYAARIRQTFDESYQAALNLSRLFYKWPHLFYKHGVKRDGATAIAARLLAGELAFPEIAGRAMEKIGAAIGKRLLPV